VRSRRRPHPRLAASGAQTVEWVYAIAFVATVVFVPVAIFLLLRRNIDFRQLERHNEVAGFTYGFAMI
jgi:hypothetical protein